MGTTKETVVIDVQLKGDAVSKSNQINKGLKDAKKSGKETTDTFGLMNTGIGKMATGVVSFGKKAVNSFKTLRGAVISTGIGALVVVVASLVQYFTKSEKGANKLKVVMSALSGVVGKISDLFVNAGKAIFKLFSSTENLKKGFKDLGKIILTNIINRFKAFGVIAKAIGKILSGHLKEGFKDLGNGVAEGVTGVENLSGKLKKGAKAAEDYAKAIKQAAKDAADLQKAENNLAIDKRNNLTVEAKLKVKLAKLNNEINDTSKTDKERLDLINKARETQNKIINEQIRQKKEEHRIQVERNKLSSSTADDKLKEAQLEADLILLEAKRNDNTRKYVAKESAIKNRQKKEREEKAKDEKEKAEEEVKRASNVNKELLKIQQDGHKLTLEEKQKNYEKDLEQRLANEEITEEESAKLKKAYAEKTALEIKDRDNEIKLEHEQEIKDQNANFNEELIEINGETREEKLEREEEEFQEDLQKQLDNKKLTQDQVDALQKAHDKKKKKIAEKNAEDEIQKTKDDANKKKQIEEELQKAKLEMVSNSLGKVSELVGKNTEAGKAAGVAQATINTYEGVTEVLASKSTLPEPFATASKIISIGTTIATGFAAVKNITSTPTPKKALGGWIAGQSHQNGGVNINGEEGEFMVNKRTMSNPILAKSVINANNIGNGNNVGNTNILTEERVAEIAATVVKSVPVNVVENDITSEQRKVQVRENRYIN